MTFHFLFKQRNTHIPILIFSAGTFLRPTEAATERCYLEQVFLKKQSKSLKNNCK